MKNSTERFTATVANYIKYRPSYPNEVLQLMLDQCGLTTSSVIADIGSGTGLLSNLFLKNGNSVYGVEPNQAMRVAGEEILKHYANFVSVNGTAEATTLKNNTIDFITVGTAFHWFDVEKAKAEFERILKKNGWVFLIWNVRDVTQSALLRDYENLLLKYGTDYTESNARKFDKTAVKEFFSPHAMKTAEFPNSQQFDWDSFKGRLLSASYSLRPEDAGYHEMLAELHTIFNRYQKNGLVDFLYQTKLFFGHLG